ncbi:uncharacterized protein Triagg1_10529 [Trichoderma aggressivum f. europaeum]|uniref:Uncharacterized protein n=1 Tax=Trichoderma aggressivum f. europaeum TaxID=173218 RepID=A0AAE1LV20_9HYPO|nr:hypothetical protein Triagg1_10529 [Trichoderma aggressivum f. europaeum]
MSWSDYTREEAEQSKTPIKDSPIPKGLIRGRFDNAVYDSTSRPMKPKREYHHLLPDLNLDNIVQKTSPDVTKGMGFTNEKRKKEERKKEPPPAPPPSINSESGAYSNEPTGSASLNVSEMALHKTVSQEDSCQEGAG